MAIFVVMSTNIVKALKTVPCLVPYFLELHKTLKAGFHKPAMTPRTETPILEHIAPKNEPIREIGC